MKWIFVCWLGVCACAAEIYALNTAELICLDKQPETKLQDFIRGTKFILCTFIIWIFAFIVVLIMSPFWFMHKMYFLFKDIFFKKT